MSEVIFLSDVRLSFPNIAKAQEQKNDDGSTRLSFNCSFLMPPTHPAVGQFMQRFGEMASGQHREHAQAIMQMIAENKKSRCYGMGEEAKNATTGIPYTGYPGNLYINAGRDTRPQLIQADGSPLNPEAANYLMMYDTLARKLYGGCRVNAAIKPWLQKPNPQRKTSHGIRCDLVAVQFLRDDTPFGEAPVDVSGMFGAIANAMPTTLAPMPTMPGMPSFVAPAVQMPGMPSFLGGGQ